MEFWEKNGVLPRVGVARELCRIPTFEAHREEQQLVQQEETKAFSVAESGVFAEG